MALWILIFTYLDSKWEQKNSGLHAMGHCSILIAILINMPFPNIFQRIYYADLFLSDFTQHSKHLLWDEPALRLHTVNVLRCVPAPAPFVEIVKFDGSPQTPCVRPGPYAVTYPLLSESTWNLNGEPVQTNTMNMLYQVATFSCRLYGSINDRS